MCWAAAGQEIAPPLFARFVSSPLMGMCTILQVKYNPNLASRANPTCSFVEEAASSSIVLQWPSQGVRLGGAGISLSD